MTRYQPIFKWYENEGGDLDSFDTIEDLVNDIEQRMLTKGTKREKTTTELQRIKDLVSSDNFKQEVDIQKSVENNLKKQIKETKDYNGLEGIESKVDPSPGLIKKSEVKELISEKRVNLQDDAIIKIRDAQTEKEIQTIVDSVPSKFRRSVRREGEFRARVLERSRK